MVGCAVLLISSDGGRWRMRSSMAARIAPRRARWNSIAKGCDTWSFIAWPVLLRKRKTPIARGFSRDRGDDATATAFNIVYETNMVRRPRYAKAVQLIF